MLFQPLPLVKVYFIFQLFQPNFRKSLYFQLCQPCWSPCYTLFNYFVGSSLSPFENIFYAYLRADPMTAPTTIGRQPDKHLYTMPVNAEQRTKKKDRLKILFVIIIYIKRTHWKIGDLCSLVPRVIDGFHSVVLG